MTRRPPNPGRIELPRRWLGLPFLQGGGFHVLREPLRLDRHAHGGWELTYLEDGEVTWETESGQRLHLQGGEFGLIEPQVAHAGELSIIRPCTLFWLIFTLSPGQDGSGDLDAETRAALSATFASAGNSVHAAAPELRAAFTSLRAQLTASGNAPGDPLTAAWLRLLLRQILLATARSLDTAAPPTGRSTLATTAERFMARNLHRDLGVAEIAQAVGTSPARFSERFKRETGLTPADALRRLRCERARDLLRTSQLPVTDIAFRLGFRSSQHFARVFRKYTGISPREFRHRP
jgi:AraC-like DNA-binding protein